MYGGTFFPLSSRMLFSMPVSRNRKSAAFPIAAALASASPAGASRYSAALRKNAAPEGSAAGGLAPLAAAANTATAITFLKFISQRHLDLPVRRDRSEDSAD